MQSEYIVKSILGCAAWHSTQRFAWTVVIQALVVYCLLLRSATFLDYAIPSWLKDRILTRSAYFFSVMCVCLMLVYSSYLQLGCLYTCILGCSYCDVHWVTRALHNAQFFSSHSLFCLRRTTNNITEQPPVKKRWIDSDVHFLPCVCVLFLICVWFDFDIQSVRTRLITH